MIGKTTLVLCALWLVGMNTSAFQTILHTEDNPRLISAVLEGPNLTDRIQKTAMTFRRDSTAYASNGRNVPQGEPRFQKIAIFNRPEYTIVEPYSKKNVVALAHCDGYFWGAQPWSTAGTTLYRSPDTVSGSAELAEAWVPVATLAAGTIQSLYVTEAGLLLVGTRKPGGVCIWDPGTESLSRVLTMLSEDPYPKHWSWAEMSGVIYVGEYGYKRGSDNARRIYQSLDGGWNWQVLYNPPPQTNYHVHKVLADPYRSHIYWSHGDWDDGAGSQLFRSSNGGQSWQLISNIEQPTAGVVRPEGAYFGSDSGGIGIYRFLDGAEKGEFVCTNLVEGYIWDMCDFDGVIYATSNYHQYVADNTIHASVMISRDGKHWGNLYQWEPGICGLERFACEVNGIVYAVMEEELYQVATMSFPEPTIRTSWGVLVEPAIENLLAGPCDSSYEGCGQISWQAYGDSVIHVSPDVTHSGNNSLKVTAIGNSGTMGAVSPVIYGNFPTGTDVSATVRVSGWNNTRWLFARIFDKTNQLASPSVHTRTGTGWTEMTVYWQLPQDSTALRVDVATSSASPGDILYIDSVALTIDKSPISFHIGGEKRAADILSHSVNFPDRWTDIFCWQPPYMPTIPVEGPKVIKSWNTKDNKSRLQLVLDQDSNFKLEEARDGSIESLASIDAPEFLPDSLIRFAIVQDNDHIGLHILCPQGWFHTSGPRAEIRPTEVFFGSTPDGTMQVGGLYSNARIYDANMSIEQIAEVINEIAEQGWVSGDLDNDGEVTFSDLCAFAESWLDTGCNSLETCARADIDMNGRVDLEDFAVIAQNWHWEK